MIITLIPDRKMEDEVEKMSTERLQMVAPCGIDCGICEMHVCKDNPQLLAYFISKGYPQDKVPCAGCRSISGHCPVIGSQCETYQCVKQQAVEFCFECQDFPCGKLNPAADRADLLPHNLKVFNLCTIRNKGLENFTETSSQFKQKYYKGKMAVGKGPQIEP